MNRSRKVVVLCHCLLNANVKVRPLATHAGALDLIVGEYLARGVGVVQLPCPETSFLGLSRWGMTREQYDHPAYRRHCRDILGPCVDQLQAMKRDGCELVGLVGVDGSPSCGMFLTCEGYRGGEAGAPETDVAGQVAGLRAVSGRGVFMEELLVLLDRHGLWIPQLAVDEESPSTLKTS